jgi:regulator of replication initiation timing
MRNTKVAGQRIPTTPNQNRSNQHRSNQHSTPPQPSYAPAVPISIYRELSSDLQATKATVESLQTHNQQLVEQNQLLRQELERIANRTQRAVQHLDQMQEQQQAPLPRRAPSGRPAADKRQPSQAIAADMLVEDYIEELPIVPEQFYRAIPEANESTAPEFGFNFPTLPPPQMVYEQALRRPLANLADASNEMPAWKLSTVIALIIASAFGAGFLVVRPLLSK